MSLHALANHMAAQGRNNDSMLVHMTPKEVGGLHALAVANGGQLTINPETGLPEAGFLQDLLPALIGFGLNTFLPGLGTAVGGAFGLGAAAGTGIAVGGLTALATGNLSKGVMAGFGAYGGAGLGESLMGAGANSIQNAAEVASSPGSARGAFMPAEGVRETALASASPMDRLTAGFSATTQSPETLMNYAKGNGQNLFAAAAPALAGLSEEDATVTKMPSPGMITPFVMNRKALPRDESLSPSAQQKYFSYGVTPITPFKAAEGGEVQESPTDSIGHFGIDEYGRQFGNPDFGKPSTTLPKLSDGPGYTPNGGGTTDPYTQQFLDKAKTYKNTMTGDSASAFDYLMGNTRPTAQTTGRTGRTGRLPTVKMPGVDPKAPASTEGIQALADIVRGGGGAPASSTGITGVYNPDVNSYTNGILPALLGQQAVPAPIVDTTGYSSVAEAEAAGLQKLANQYGMYNNPNANLTPTGTNVGTVSQPNPISGYSIGPAASIPAANPMTQDPAQQQQAAADGPQAEQAQAEQAQAVSTPVTYSPITTSDLPSNDNYSNEGRNYSGANDSGSRYSGDNSGDNSGWGSRDAGGDARGGFLNNGRFDQRYADGGVTGGGNIDLHVPINIGGGGGSTGAETFGGGFGGGNNIQQGGMLQSPMGGLGSLLGQLQPQTPQTPQAPQAFAQQATDEMAQQQQFMQPFGGINAQAPQQQQLMQQATQGLGKQNQAFGGNMGGMRYGAFAEGGMTGMADGGLGSLGGYSDGGRLLRGPGDGVSDSIPATIGQHQPARLADGEFVVPARIVSELGNGSTEAGARQLYAMMDRIQKGRKKTVGKNKVAANTRAAKHLPA